VVFGGVCVWCVFFFSFLGSFFFFVVFFFVVFSLVLVFFFGVFFFGSGVLPFCGVFFFGGGFLSFSLGCFFCGWLVFLVVWGWGWSFSVFFNKRRLVYPLFRPPLSIGFGTSDCGVLRDCVLRRPSHPPPFPRTFFQKFQVIVLLLANPRHAVSPFQTSGPTPTMLILASLF